MTIEDKELIKHLDKLILNCNENELEFKKIGFEYSSLSSGAMSVAYNNIKHFIINRNDNKGITES